MSTRNLEMRVVEMKMLNRMFGHTRTDKIKNENIKKKVKIALIERKFQ